MSYFSALVARTGSPKSTWVSRDVDTDALAEVESGSELGALVARAGEEGDGPTLVLIEHEDEWFAIVRIEDDEDPQVFVSDPAAASESPFAQMLGMEVTDEELGSEPVGDLDLLADCGVPAAKLRALCEGEEAIASADGLGVVAEWAGFDEVLDSLR